MEKLRLTVYCLVFSFLIVVAGFGVWRAMAAENAAMPAVGDKAPGFTLQSQEGKPVSLGDFHGQWVVLYFFPKDFTPGCTIEAHNFQRDLAQYTARHAAILGVSVDTGSSHKEFCTKEGLNFKLLADTNRTVSRAYGSLMGVGNVSLSARNTFIIDPAGMVAKVFTGVKPASHSPEVLAALDELQKPADKKN